LKKAIYTAIDRLAQTQNTSTSRDGRDGRQKTSQFLRYLSNLSRYGSIREAIMHLIGRLPAQTQVILVTRNKDNLNSVAEQADRIHEIGNKTTVLDTTRPPARRRRIQSKNCEGK